MKKHYLKLTGLVSSSILSCSLLISPLSSNAAMKIRPTVGGGNSNTFRPISPAPKTNNSSKIFRPNPTRPLVTPFNPSYDTNSNGTIGSASSRSSSMRSVSSTGSSNFSTGNSTPTLPVNNNQRQTNRNSSDRKFTNAALTTMTVMSLIGAGWGIADIVRKTQTNSTQNNNNEENNFKPSINGYQTN